MLPGGEARNPHCTHTPAHTTAPAPIAEQDAVDVAIQTLCYMLADVDNAVLARMVKLGAAVAIIGRQQATTDIPPHSHLRGVQCGNGGGTYDESTRGMGGHPCCPTCRCMPVCVALMALLWERACHLNASFATPSHSAAWVRRTCLCWMRIAIPLSPSWCTSSPILSWTWVCMAHRCECGDRRWQRSAVLQWRGRGKRISPCNPVALQVVQIDQGAASCHTSPCPSHAGGHRGSLPCCPCQRRLQ